MIFVWFPSCSVVMQKEEFDRLETSTQILKKKVELMKKNCCLSENCWQSVYKSNIVLKYVALQWIVALAIENGINQWRDAEKAKSTPGTKTLTHLTETTSNFLYLSWPFFFVSRLYSRFNFGFFYSFSIVSIIFMFLSQVLRFCVVILEWCCRKRATIHGEKLAWTL